MEDPFNLRRFVQAQADDYEDACAELRGGMKAGHWMWFIFPQFIGLGESHMSRKYAIHSLDEARAYLDHPVLGPRLRHCTRLVCSHADKNIQDIFGYPDYLKFRSCITLFARAAQDNQIFVDALRLFFDGVPDPVTTRLL